MDNFVHLFTHDTLTLVVFFPTLAVLPLLFFPRGSDGAVKVYTLVATLVELVIGGWYLLSRQAPGAPFPFVRELGLDGQPIAWIQRWGIRYELAIDGISMPLVALTLLLMPIVILGSWKGIEKHWKAYGAAMLLLTTGMLGVFLAFDLFLFYVFWELVLVPMYLIIGIWGGERKIYAALKFFLYTMAGSLPMLVALLWLGWRQHEVTGVWSFAYADLLQLPLPLQPQLWLFAAFALAFAIKVPMFPLHTWLPDAHVEAPTGGSVILAGVLLKLGTYGFLRIAFPLFPQASVRLGMPLVVLALIGILYGALVAWVQTDMKKLVAYSSVAHLGFVMLGLLAFDLVAWQGALLQMVNHGLSTGALFLLVGMLYDRRHTKKFDEFGGLAKVIPVFAFFLVFSSLASVGLPMLNGFAGEFPILVGSYKSEVLDLRWATVAATLGVVLAAIYLLKMLYLTLWGPITRVENEGLKDLSAREVLALVPLCVFMLWIGVAPAFFMDPSAAHLGQLLGNVRARIEQPAQPDRVAAHPQQRRQRPTAVTATSADSIYATARVAAEPAPVAPAAAAGGAP
ncbi:MAG TPA: NADH-quinone oxidoreductase subunit M [Thermoanaerobaculia bacterium]|nr:NADH-quinone oxidoreductase subunit M [Thermoanaerobaculia bacterium]